MFTRKVTLRKRMICISSLIILQLCTVVQAEIPNGYFTDVKPITEINTMYHDLSPTISYDGLTMIFTSGRPGGLGSDDLWMATRNEPNEPFGNLTNLTVINSSATDSSSTLSSDGLTLIFASKRTGDWNLYQATRLEPNQAFDNVTDLGSGVNTSDVEYSPSLSADGLSLYFHSNRPGGHGENDIWMVTRNTVCESFGNPVNLGSPLNSVYNEYGPNISSDSLYLFFSDSINQGEIPRPGGKGGVDIWISTRASIDDSFGIPTNLNDLWPGSEINSSFGEGFPCISPDWPADGTKLYFGYAQTADPPGIELYEATWVLNCKYKLAGDLNDDCRNDLYDLAIMLTNWLIDCNVTPNDPACVPK